MLAELSTTHSWISAIHGGSAGAIQIASPASWAGQFFPTTPDGINQAVQYVAQLDRQQVQGIYMRMTTVKASEVDRIIAGHGRGSAADAHMLPCLWADMDIFGPGHKHRPNHPDLEGYKPNRPILLPLPPDEAAVAQILETTGLPQPTTLIHSGGGMYPIFGFEQPEDLDADEWSRNLAATTSERLQHLISLASAHHGYHYGTEVSDLARVLRLPGTINRKAGLQRQCVIVPTPGERPRYDLLAFSVMVEEGIARLRPEQPPAVSAPASGPPATVTPPISSPPTFSGGSVRPADVGLTPLDDYEARTSWEEILEPAGWTRHHQAGATTYWTRPGKDRRDGTSATTGYAGDRDRMFCFSSSAGLPTSEPMTKGFVYAQLHYAGNMVETARQLRAMGFGTPPVASSQPIQAPPPAGGAPVENPTAGQLPPVTMCPSTPVWTMPKSFDATGNQLPEFPLQSLPPVMRTFAEGVVAQLQVPADAVALSMLSTVSGVAGHKFVTYLPSRDWIEPPVLYTMSVMSPGERKSPTFKMVTAPLRKLDKKVAREWAERCEMQIHQLRATGDTLSGDKVTRNMAEDNIKRIEDSKKHPPRHLLPTDSTAEALAMALVRNGGRGTILDAEGEIASTIFSGRYTTAPNIGLILSAYDGEMHHSERISRDPIVIDRPLLSLGLAVQPVVLRNLLNSETAVHRGLFDRFIFSVPRRKVGIRNIRSSAVCGDQAKRDWAKVIDTLGEYGAPNPDVDEEDIPKLVLTPDALELHTVFMEEMERRMADGGDLSYMAGWISKHAGRALRIAALLHLAAGYDNHTEIGDVAMQCAINICRWAIIHAQHVFGATPVDEDNETADDTQCVYVINALDRKGVTQFTRRELSKLVQTRWATSRVLTDVVDQMCERGWLKAELYFDGAGVRRTRYHLNPNRPNGG